ncbi:low molecular weight protein-tyrosine-phosphatase [Corynebacterium auriscanis]|uniref:low molecular weight protein-tyrosine-phosphatase n=1 Tax=Corynebacterium auriscanis TaxID=99807 RepID=UPI003CEAB5F5
MKISVVCTGNICRSPMGEVMLRSALEQAGLADAVDVNSCGLGGWHVGDGADRRAVAQLKQDGYDGTAHVAAQFGPEHADADMFLAMDHGHVSGLIDNGVDPHKIYLFRAFDPASHTGEIDDHNAPEVDDPYYGPDSGFATTAFEINNALPGITNFVRKQVEAGG